MTAVIILCEEALQASDIAHVHSLYPHDSLHVLIPLRRRQGLVAAFLDHLSMLDLRAAWDSVIDPAREEPTEGEVRAALADSLAAIERAGIRGDGDVLEVNPIDALPRAIENLRAEAVVVVTTPHAVEDTFHQDWASKAREELSVPVLHLYAGTSRVG